MNFFMHPVAQRLIDKLVLLHHALAYKSRTDDHRLEMTAIALYLYMGTLQALFNICFNVFRCGHVNSVIYNRS